MSRLFLVVMLLSAGSPVFAVEPEEMLADPVLENRAREISAGLRCLVCQNQSIDDSDAPLAKDLRILVRDQLNRGQSDHQIMAYIVSRYGEFVLLKPPFNRATYVLWLGPVVIAGAGLLVITMVFRRKRAAAQGGEHEPGGLSKEDRKRLDALLEDTLPESEGNKSP